eukprot:3113329-Alexandrium_andersonii.AAC.1
MSASLVGSEMCIRDSTRPGSALRPGRNERIWGRTHMRSPPWTSTRPSINATVACFTACSFCRASLVESCLGTSLSLRWRPFVAR